jgi:cell division protease FtsH
VKAREEILQVHSKNKPIEKTVDFAAIARKSVGFSGAELMNVMNEAAIYAAKMKHKKITQKDIDEAIAKIHMGPERKSRVRTEEDLLNTAYHEAGHALVAANLKYCHPVYKITIVSRGQSLGTTWYMPKDDVTSMKKVEFEHSLASVLAGRIAEELTFGEEKVTTGAYGDFMSATKMAREMVVKYGMSDKLGARVYTFETNYSRNYSEQTARDIDKEVLDIINAAYKIATDILKKQAQKLKDIAEALLEHETLDKDAFELILGKQQACELA